MLSKRRCPYTGVVNFYSDEDPHMAVGSVVAGNERGFFWRYYTEPFARGGLASDIGSAEREVRAAGLMAERQAQGDTRLAH
ncbi:MAG: hypothetical protein NW223_03150 [Hyphomicrobiaceae bacterium]|nr:hypothetical protein [Hyphomicrobiaceae bacterium]